VRSGKERRKHHGLTFFNNLLGRLSQSLVNFDPEARERARKLRRKALGLSLLLEALLLAAMLI
jgi:hypothetical protein